VRRGLERQLNNAFEIDRVECCGHAAHRRARR